MSEHLRLRPWKASLHGGHSSRFCDHAQSTLTEILDAAVSVGYHTFGVAEHAPRVEAQFLYDEEIEMGWTVETLQGRFREYAAVLDEIDSVYEGRLSILKGFEAEVVPCKTYPEIMLAYRRELNFDYMVGSVHYVDGIIFDYKQSHFERALEACGGYEGLAIRYYRELADMVATLSPEVVGHFDVIRKNFPLKINAASPPIVNAALEAMEVIREKDAILDVNTASYRKGGGCPYPAPNYIEAARDMGIPVCFGDDSHSAEQVGAGLEQAREYLLQHGVTSITTLERGGSGLNRRQCSLLGTPRN